VRFKLLAVAAAATALLVAGLTGQAGASGKPSTASHGNAVVVRSTDAALLYSQNDNGAKVGVVSQNFEEANDAFDAAGADDVTVPAGVAWMVQSVTVSGSYFNGSGPAVSETVTFYADSAGKPGAVVKSLTATGTDSAGSFVIRMPEKVKLRPGTYWVSVVANMDFGAGGEWGWATRLVQNGGASQWQNPGDGFATGCTTWSDQATCTGGIAGPDFMFALNGKTMLVP